MRVVVSLRSPSVGLRTIRRGKKHRPTTRVSLSERAAFPPPTDRDRPTDRLRSEEKTVGEREAAAAAGKGAASSGGRQRPGDYPIDSSFHEATLKPIIIRIMVFLPRVVSLLFGKLECAFHARSKCMPLTFMWWRAPLSRRLPHCPGRARAPVRQKVTLVDPGTPPIHSAVGSLPRGFVSSRHFVCDSGVHEKGY